jgi:MFS transporter, AAHS family, cis,cis-muconate transporter
LGLRLVGWVNPGVYGSTSVYVSELHPTHLRATAVGWFFGIGRIGSFLAPSVMGFMLAFLAVGVETKGRVLEEITTSETRLQS